MQVNIIEMSLQINIYCDMQRSTLFFKSNQFLSN